MDINNFAKYKVIKHFPIYSIHLLQTWRLFFTLVTDMETILYTSYRHGDYFINWLQTWRLFYTLVTDMETILYTGYRHGDYFMH